VKCAAVTIGVEQWRMVGVALRGGKYGDGGIAVAVRDIAFWEEKGRKGRVAKKCGRL